MTAIQTKSNAELDRRRFLRIATAGICAATLIPETLLGIPAQKKLKAIAFDALAIFDTRPVFEMTTKLFPDCGVELSSEWRTRQFEYTWLRTVSGRYTDFWRVTEDALTYAANKTKVKISAQDKHRLMNSYLRLKPWPDVVPTLGVLKNTGIRTALLSNFTSTMMNSCVEFSGLRNTFNYLLSTDAVKKFKPAPEAYRMGINVFQLHREEILFVAFAGWDAVGAKMFGYPTYWANRFNAPHEELGVTADRSATNLDDILPFFGSASV